MTGIELNWEIASVAALIGLAGAFVGGAVGGLATGGKALGNEVATMMGAFFGPVGGFTGVVLALVVLAFIG